MGIEEKIMTHKRITYLDVAKGLLILLVIYDHLPDVYLTLLERDNLFIEYLNEGQWIYKLFFMPAFFCITGMCSNFNKKFHPFLISNFKTLIIPNLVFSVLLNPVDPNILKILLLGGGAFWFLTALFLAKVIYWLINKYFPSNPIIRIFILISMVFIGFVFNNVSPRYDIWNFHYAFNLAVFIEMGHFLKRTKNSNYLYLGSICYIIICLGLMFFNNIHRPVMALGCSCEIYEVPLYLLSASSGTCLILLISKWINHNRVLQFFGKETLLFYVLQVKILYLCEFVYVLFFSVDGLISVLFFVCVIFLLTIAILSVLSRLIESNKYLLYLIGRF